MYKKENIYWTCQFSGWFFYTTINLLFFKLSYQTSFLDIINFLLWFPLGISITHLYKVLIQKLNIFKYKIFFQIPFTIVSSFLMAFVFFLFNLFVVKIFGNTSNQIDYIAAISKILSLMLIFIIWSVIYFAYHYFTNYRKTEIQNLKLLANKNETELNTLKSQLNPHFIFNSLNSITALIDENPPKAKRAINQLSNILRSTLMIHKNKFIKFEEEIKLVTDYLELELMRYEERIQYHLEIDSNTLKLPIPPMMIQTLVENAIKHGINKSIEGGEIILKSLLDNRTFKLEVKNTGQLDFQTKTNSGIGVENTNNRLQLLYGNNATFNLRNFDNKNVVSEITINV
ncbi:MAG: sensor histidine kinase [Bacteroidota bacterium]